MSSTRERKERFILTFGKITGQTGNDAVSSCLRDNGLEVFPDWAIDSMVEDCIRSARSAIKRNRENRQANAAYFRRMSNAMEA